MLLSSADIM